MGTIVTGAGVVFEVVTSETIVGAVVGAAVAATGATAAVHGTSTAKNALNHLTNSTKQNTKGQQKTAHENLEEISKAKDKAGKDSPAGMEQNRIRDTKRGKQNADKELNERKNEFNNQQ